MPSLTKLVNIRVYDDKNTQLGVLRDVTFDKASGKCSLVLDTGAYSADKWSLRQYMLILYNAKRVNDGNGATVMGKTAYNAQGNRVGTVIDVKFGRTMKLDKVICDNEQVLTRGLLQGVGDVIIVKTPRPQKTKTAPPKPTASTAEVTETEIVITDKQDKRPAPKAKYPKRRYGDFNFLLGKIVDKNITNFYDEVMIRAGDKVTAETLRQAKISGKLVELCLHTKQ